MIKSRFKIGIILPMMILVLSATACSGIQDKAAEKISEGIVEEALGGKVDIQDGGSKIVMEDGEMETGEDLEWPEEAMGDLPIPKAKVTFIMKDDSVKGCTVTLAEFKLKDAEAYLEELEAMGFIEAMNMQDTDLFMYSGKREDGTEVYYNYNIEPEEGLLTFQKPQ